MLGCPLTGAAKWMCADSLCCPLIRHHQHQQRRRQHPQRQRSAELLVPPLSLYLRDGCRLTRDTHTHSGWKAHFYLCKHTHNHSRLPYLWRRQQVEQQRRRPTLGRSTLTLSSLSGSLGRLLQAPSFVVSPRSRRPSSSSSCCWSKKSSSLWWTDGWLCCCCCSCRCGSV